MKRVASPKRKRKGGEQIVGRLRIGYLNKFFAHRYGGGKDYVFPDDDAGREDLRILLDHYYWSNPFAMARALRRRAPWMSKESAEGMLAHVEAFPRRYRSATLGKLLGFSGKEWRQGHRFPTIAPFDMTAQERKDFARILETAKRRKERGQMTRDEYLAANTLSRDEPWKALGMSRRDWYRKGKPTKNGLAQVGGNKDYSLTYTQLVVPTPSPTPDSPAHANSFPKRPDQHSRAELEAIFAKKRKPAWSTPTMIEIPYTPTLRALYADMVLAA